MEIWHPQINHGGLSISQATPVKLNSAVFRIAWHLDPTVALWRWKIDRAVYHPFEGGLTVVFGSIASHTESVEAECREI
jgi:hypothetical protein